jgi:hypothetical protein
MVEQKRKRKKKVNALSVWLISRTFLANEQYFSIKTNQRTILSAMTFQPSEPGGMLQWQTTPDALRE